ncbi:MAG TPA: sugar phosphate isomerase/epimerase [Thermomicrobiales bacterium]|nr:sugar phosphate isomerase/epimerase [Thermomicrobiales bacterium]
MKMDQVAVQMYTLRQHATEDLDGTLWRLSDIGYKKVEFAGFYDNAAEDVAAMLERHDLTAPAAHIPYARFESEFDNVIADAQAVGLEWAIVPSLPRREIDEGLAQEYISKLNSFALLAEEAGLKFAYHNHAFEFENEYGDGTTFFDRLAAGTDPDKVKLELDAFWVNRGGFDPARILRDHGDRVRLVHLKDAARGHADSDIPFGEGALDWEAILGAADAAGVEYYVVEQDNPGDAFEDVTVALRNAEKWSES